MRRSDPRPRRSTLVWLALLGLGLGLPALAQQGARMVTGACSTMGPMTVEIITVAVLVGSLVALALMEWRLRAEGWSLAEALSESVARPGGDPAGGQQQPSDRHGGHAGTAAAVSGLRDLRPLQLRPDLHDAEQHRYGHPLSLCRADAVRALHRQQVLECVPADVPARPQPRRESRKHRCRKPSGAGGATGSRDDACPCHRSCRGLRSTRCWQNRPSTRGRASPTGLTTHPGRARSSSATATPRRCTADNHNHNHSEDGHGRTALNPSTYCGSASPHTIAPANPYAPAVS